MEVDLITSGADEEDAIEFDDYSNNNVFSIASLFYLFIYYYYSLVCSSYAELRFNFVGSLQL